jgi:acyl carrier protein
MSMLVEERTARIKELVCGILELDEDEVTDESLFQEEHGSDSLRAIEILASVEKEFNIVIEQDQLGRLVNLKGVYEVVAEASGW